MQLTATTTAAKPLPVDLLPESSPAFLSPNIFLSPQFRNCRRQGGIAFEGFKGCGFAAALNNPRWFRAGSFTYVSFRYFVKEV